MFDKCLSRELYRSLPDGTVLEGRLKLDVLSDSMMDRTALNDMDDMQSYESCEISCVIQVYFSICAAITAIRIMHKFSRTSQRLQTNLFI